MRQHEPLDARSRRTRVYARGGGKAEPGGDSGLETRVFDAVAGELASRNHGVVSRRQLLDAGVSAKQVERRIRTGGLVALHRGVYAVGHLALPPLAGEAAALLASGPGSVLSHRSAAVLWGLLPGGGGPIEVTRAGTRRDARDGIRLHCVGVLTDNDVRRRHGLALTGPVRTLLDLAAAGSADLEAALGEAVLRRAVDPAVLLARVAGRPGARAVRALLAEATPTRSEAERRLLALVRRAGLPAPRTNVRVGRWEVDALWPAERLVVEVDGYAFHSGRAAFERDRLRDAELQAAGFRVVRVTWRGLVDRGEAVAVRLGILLAGA